MMTAKPAVARFARSAGRIATQATAADFSDPESQRVLASAARGLAYELGRQAAREAFAADVTTNVKASK
jgi:hypothetical protein